MADFAREKREGARRRRGNGGPAAAARGAHAEKGPDPTGLDSDIENPELWAAQQLRVRTIDAANNTVVSMEEMPGSNVYVTRDQIGRLLYNCIVFGKRILMVTPDDPEAPEEVRENVKASW